jgi:DNA-binding FrmR family transcriptional regulator
VSAHEPVERKSREVSNVDIDDDVKAELQRRLARVEGQVRGIQNMLADDRECRDVVTQIAAASKALDQVGFRLLASGLTQCLQDPDQAEADGYPVAEVEKMFLKLA